MFFSTFFLNFYLEVKQSKQNILLFLFCFGTRPITNSVVPELLLAQYSGNHAVPGIKPLTSPLCAFPSLWNSDLRFFFLFVHLSSLISRKISRTFKWFERSGWEIGPNAVEIRPYSWLIPWFKGTWVLGIKMSSSTCKENDPFLYYLSIPLKNFL